MPWSNQAIVPVDLLVTSSFAVTVPAGGSLPLRNLVIDQISYLIVVDAECVAAPSVPFYSVSVQWKDPNTGTLLALDKWLLMATNVAPASGNCLVTGRGPSRAARLDVVILNEDAVNAITVDVSVYQSSRVLTRDDWRSLSNNISGTYTYGGQTFSTPVSEPTSLVLGNSPSITIAAGSSQSRINALFAGEAQLFVRVTGTTPTGSITLYGVDPDWATPLQQIYSADVTVDGVFTPFVALPRMLTVIQFVNTGTNSMTVQYSLIAQEIAA